MDQKPRETTANVDASENANKTLNFKVSEAFKREFKGFAVSRGITMTDLLKEGFELVKKSQRT